jgi:hypothetical protein
LSFSTIVQALMVPYAGGRTLASLEITGLHTVVYLTGECKRLCVLNFEYYLWEGDDDLFFGDQEEDFFTLMISP